MKPAFDFILIAISRVPEETFLIEGDPKYLTALYKKMAPDVGTVAFNVLTRQPVAVEALKKALPVEWGLVWYRSWVKLKKIPHDGSSVKQGELYRKLAEAAALQAHSRRLTVMPRIPGREVPTKK